MDTNNKQPQKKKKWFLSLVFSLLVSTLLIVITISISSTTTRLYNRARVFNPRPKFVEEELDVMPTSSEKIPRLAYLISGSTGDGESLKRTLKALYHPRNQYAVHLDLEASVKERMELARFVETQPLFKEVGNVRMVVRANLVTYRGPTMVSNTLHAASILLKKGGDWDWFINLSASDYPLVTQDGIKCFFFSLCCLFGAIWITFFVLILLWILEFETRLPRYLKLLTLLLLLTVLLLILLMAVAEFVVLVSDFLLVGYLTDTFNSDFSVSWAWIV